MSMYMLENNRLLAVSQTSFKKENQTERQNLQEWIANASNEILKDIFNEELLIIQKEFSGFSDTNERLDLLAIDKQRRLVVIENKTDDSGKDVTWQAIKYASYCSTLSTQDIKNIFAQYKFRGNTQDATDAIKDFLGSDTGDEFELNIDENSPRIFLVAANFRKEVTSSVLWLSKFRLNIKCFKVSLFEHNKQVFIDFDQIIPIKDAEEYTIRMAKKSQEMAQSSAAGEERKKFWAEFVKYNKENNGPYEDLTPLKDSWLGKSFGISGISINVVANNNNCRIETYICSVNGDKKRNKNVFDFYYGLKDEIESNIPGFPLVWERRDDKSTCSIKSEKQLSYLNPDERDTAIEFLTNGSKRFLEVFSSYNDDLKKIIK